MRIKSVTLNNFRLYHGENTIFFDQKDEKKNMFIISGQNGFGKTTFLQSLLWCLYGRIITEIDDVIKREVSARGGYNTLIYSSLNNICQQYLNTIPVAKVNRIKKSGYSVGDEEIAKNALYSVSIDFCDVFIPSIPCRSLVITRSFDAIFEKENLEILIDGKTNELSSEIGNDVFINDFVLNKDIARFFFFDSEKIVSLAETNTLEEKRRLNSAYNEVLGLKKYEDLKKNLENLRLRFRKKSSDIESRNKLNSLFDKQKAVEKRLSDLEAELSDLEAKLPELQQKNEDLQIQLLREGNGTSLDELRRQEDLVKTTKQKDLEYKNRIKTFLDYAPFAICGKLFLAAKQQADNDCDVSQSQTEIQNQNALIRRIKTDLKKFVSETITNEDEKGKILNRIQSLSDRYSSKEVCGERLTKLSNEEYQDIFAVFNNVSSTYKIEFEHLADDYKKNKQILEKASRKIANMHSNENDEVIKNIRLQKNSVEKEINTLQSKIHSLYEAKGETGKELAVTNKQISELGKRVSVDGSDEKKDELAKQLVEELDSFLAKLKQEKKKSLEVKIKNTLNNLMHKTDFIGNVKVIIVEDCMDVVLYSPDNDVINKDSLSKGEQQLYATSLLKALVDESGIEFPVFIDSPLQKFDKSHSNKIITEFYPYVSKQVILFPLLHKELTLSELDIMKPWINAAYLIKNQNHESYFEKVGLEQLMEE
ncbi:MAG: AAA family ATPase [Alphaproteobacteria bacterium]|nr:AAA family ATPase [Alphaproteobacteria bacterium]